MKNYLLLAAALGLLASAASAATCTTAICKTDGTLTVNSGGSITVASGGTFSNAGTQTLTGTVDTSGVVFSTALTGNPVMQMTYKDLTVSTDLSSTAMATVIASTTGKSIYPGAGLSIMVSGTAATATALALECSGGRLIAQWPIADLVDLLPIGTGLYLSTNSTITTGAGLTKGCPSGEALMLSNVGAKITTTTHVYVNVPYVVQ